MDTIPYAVSAPSLYATLGMPVAPLFVDVRRTAAWHASDRFTASAGGKHSEDQSRGRPN